MIVVTVLAMFYKSDLGPSGIETLLDEVDAVNAMRELRSEPKDKDKDEIPDSITGCDAFSNFPEIEKFLDEEGTLNAWFLFSGFF